MCIRDRPTAGNTGNTVTLVPVADGDQLLLNGMVLMDIVWIIAGIFISAIAIAVILGHTHGTFI